MSARIAKETTLSPSLFHKRYTSSYETPSPSSSPTLPIRKSYRGTSKLEEDTEDESSDSDAEREGLKDKGPGSEDEGPSLEEEGHGSEDEGPSSEEEEEATLKGHQQAVLVVDTAADKPLGLGYGALRCHELALGDGSRVEETPTPRPRVRTTWVDLVDGIVYTDISVDVPPARVLVQTPPSPEWSSGSLPVSPSSPAVPTLVTSPVTTPAAIIVVGEDEFLELYGLRSLEQEQEGDTVTFGAIWRPVLALESWAGYVDAQRAEMWRARYDDHRLIHDLLVHNTTMQRELQEVRDRVTTLEQERSRRGQ
ncbi:hypothetical protein Tco_0524767 [Tanacetum coccineum]